MNIHLYIFVVTVIFTIITCISFGSLFKKDNLKKINDIGSLLVVILYSTFLYFYKDYSDIFSNKNDYMYFFYWSGIILYCYGYFLAFVDTIKYSSINFLIFSTLFLVGSLLFLYHSLIVEKNYSLNNHIFSLYDSVFYTLSSLFYLIYYYYNKFIYIFIGTVFLLIGRFISLYIGYNNLKTKKLNNIKL